MRVPNLTTDANAKLLDDAIAANRLGNRANAVKILKRLIVQDPSSAAANGYLAGIYFDQSKFSDAEMLFRNSTLLSRKSEMASLGLFHSLWNLSRYSEAFAEMRRYLTVSESKEYSKLLRDFVVSGAIEPELEVVGV